MGKMERFRARVAEFEVLADRRMTVVDEVDGRDLKRQALMGEANGERLAAGQDVFGRAQQSELAIRSRAGVPVAEESELPGHTCVEGSRQDEVHASRQVGPAAGEEARVRTEGNGSLHQVVAN